MTDKEVMQDALDALESLQAWPETPENFKRFRAIEALRARIAQPENDFNPDWDAMAVMVEEQQRMAKRIEELEARLAQPEQEPVAWFTEDHREDKSATTYSKKMSERWKEKGWPVTPLYTSPPQREWQGLTYDEIRNEANHHVFDESFFSGAIWARGKIKEKNNG